MGTTIALILSIIAISLVGLFGFLVLGTYISMNRLKIFEKKASTFISQIGQNSLHNTDTMVKNFNVISKKFKDIDIFLKEDDEIDGAVKEALIRKNKKDYN